MIYNKYLYLKRIVHVAQRLESYVQDVVFVGGAVVALYADDPAADEVRPTEDIDIVVELTTYKEYSRFEEIIRGLGFVNDTESSVLCRYRIDGLVVDIMPVDEAVLGFTNRWYKEGVKESIQYEINPSTTIRIMSFPYFIAAKIEAHRSRGGTDLRTSTDFEDIVYLFDNRLEPLQDLLQAPGDVRNYLIAQISNFLLDSNLEEGIYSHLVTRTASARMRRIKGIWHTFTH
jgi:hypothetical protein